MKYIRTKGIELVGELVLRLVWVKDNRIDKMDVKFKKKGQTGKLLLNLVMMKDNIVDMM